MLKKSSITTALVLTSSSVFAHHEHLEGMSNDVLLLALALTGSAIGLVAWAAKKSFSNQQSAVLQPSKESK